jgi:adenylate cyclase
VAADVAAYGRLMRQNDERTLADLKSARQTLILPAVTVHRGRIVKTVSGEMLLEFPSAVDAAQCALEVQRGMALRNVAIPADERIEFRIGIHLGDVMIDENDIFGDGVNIAARLEKPAEPGGICISDDAHRQVRGKVNAVFDDLGAQTLKNITDRCGHGESGSAASRFRNRWSFQPRRAARLRCPTCRRSQCCRSRT